MPVEVLRFMDALRQAWSEDGTVLRITTHPYTSKADCAIGSFLNPDLCPRWVNWIMTKNDAMAKSLGMAARALWGSRHCVSLR